MLNLIAGFYYDLSSTWIGPVWLFCWLVYASQLSWFFWSEIEPTPTLPESEAVVFLQKMRPGVLWKASVLTLITRLSVCRSSNSMQVVPILWQFIRGIKTFSVLSLSSINCIEDVVPNYNVRLLLEISEIKRKLNFVREFGLKDKPLHIFGGNSGIKFLSRRFNNLSLMFRSSIWVIFSPGAILENLAKPWRLDSSDPDTLISVSDKDLEHWSESKPFFWANLACDSWISRSLGNWLHMYSILVSSCLYLVFEDFDKTL